jgi:YrbI family 3-deoxy-D-manno-octulosonate 8-phosphate phosphatase
MKKQKTIAFVPIRSKSKGIKDKNIKNFCGKPLVYWVLKAAQECDLIDKIIVASDSGRYNNLIYRFNFNKVRIYDRDEENCQDESTTESVMLEFLEKSKKNEIGYIDYKFDEKDDFILIQATNPFLTCKNLYEAIIIRDGSRSIFSAVKDKSFFWKGKICASACNYDYQNRPRRQEHKNYRYKENGSFYINKIKNILSLRNRICAIPDLYEMPWYSQFEIDEPEDWELCEYLFSKYVLMGKKINSKDIKLFISDIDGTLTDGGMYYSRDLEHKKYNTKDGKGLELLRNARIKIGLITQELFTPNSRRVNKICCDFFLEGITNKFIKIAELCEKEQVELSQVAYIGDDLNDFELLSKVGLAACPADAVNKIKEISGIIILENKGGHGAVREFIDKYIITQ